MHGRQGIEGTGRLSSRCPSAVKFALIDEAIIDVDRNKHDLESYLFIKQKQIKRNLAARTSKNLAVIESTCPSTIKHVSDSQKWKQRHNYVRQWNRPVIRTIEILQLPTIKYQTPRYHVTSYTSNQKCMPNVCVSGKTDEVIIFLLKVWLDVSSSIILQTFIHIATTKMIGIAY